MDIYTVDCAIQKDPLSEDFYTSLVVTKTPLRWMVVDHLVRAIRFVADHPILDAIDDMILRNEEEFEVPVVEEVADRYARWRGWDLDYVTDEELA